MNTPPESPLTSYCLHSLQEKVYTLPSDESSDKPTIGISPNWEGDTLLLRETYIRSLVHCGATPLVIPKTTDAETIVRAVRKCDAIILSGGGDIHPLWLDAPASTHLGKVRTEKDIFDFTIFYAAVRYSIPILGICRGEQVGAVALGAHLVQDIPSEIFGSLPHNQTAGIYELWHSIEVHAQGRLRDILRGRSGLQVNSMHHQSIKDLPEGCVVCATSSDGVIEAIDGYPQTPFLGVQWHPETLAFQGIESHKHIFEFLTKEAKLYHRARSFHSRHITLDSHVDTPMLFDSVEEYDLCKRSAKALVDIPKMVDGGLDCVCMVAYTPQGKLTDEGHDEAYKYTVKTLQSIDTLAVKTKGKASVGNTAEDIQQNKKQNTLTILKGIENGYPLWNQSERVEEFGRMGVRYITLCHNGDNLLCDSASRTQHTHGGLSKLGKEMVRQMNKAGILVDLSHCGSNTIRDVLDLTQAPVIASHSSCRSLLDHPRNLTDDEMRGIAATGGVAQMCMYKGFLHFPEDEATLIHFIDHVCHAVSVVGVEHVGIGSDFDGDGGVIGCRDASQAIRITIELLRRGFQEEEIAKIWGGNFLRAMEDARALRTVSY